MIVSSYFDESYGADDILCVAGYSFAARNARQLDGDWRKMLARYKRLPFFRMSLCNMRFDPFDRLTEQECIDVATDAIGLINKYASYGYAVTVDKKAFNKIITKHGVVSTPYELCVWLCLTAARSEMNKIMRASGMSFLFETGFEHQPQANKMLNNIFKSPQLKEWFNYTSHSFVDKERCRPAQAADLLAWQWYKDMTRRARGMMQPRGDLRALTDGTRHFAIHLSADVLQDLVTRINAKAGTPLGNEIAGIALRNPSSALFPQRPGEQGSLTEYEKLKKQYPERFKDDP